MFNSLLGGCMICTSRRRRKFRGPTQPRHASITDFVEGPARNQGFQHQDLETWDVAGLVMTFTGLAMV